MKKLHGFAQRMVASAVVLVMIGLMNQALAQGAAVLKAEVVKVKGSARYSSDNRTWQTLKKGEILRSGSLIQTGEKSVVDIAIGESAASLHVVENTVLGVDKLTSEKIGNDEAWEIQLDLRAGQIAGRTDKLSDASKYEIKFAGGVAGVLNGQYAISASGVVDVTEGLVIVAAPAADGSITPKEVKAGQRFQAGLGRVTASPEASGGQHKSELPKPEGESRPTPPPSGPPIRPGV
jgi:hypothetical protein